MKIVAALVGIHIGVIVARIFDGRAPIGGGWRLIYVMTLCGSLLFAFLQVFLSSMPWKAVFAALLLFVSGVVALYRSTRGEQPSTIGTIRAFMVTIALCVAIGIESYSARARQHFLGDHGASMTYESTNPRLAGLRLPANGIFQSLDALAAYLNGRVELGDFLLVDGYAAGIYYLVGARPAWDHAFPSYNLPVAHTRESIRKMVAADRVPEHVVRFLWSRPDILARQSPTLESDDPTAAFISQHYEHETTFGLIELWQLKSEASLSSQR